MKTITAVIVLEPINKVSTDFTSPSKGEDKEPAPYLIRGESELKGEGSQGEDS